jgi:hypothetical protein
MTAAPRRSAATALACALRSSSSAPSTSSTVTSSSSLLLRRFSTSSDKGEGSVHFDDGSGEKLAEVLDHALVRERERERELEFVEGGAKEEKRERSSRPNQTKGGNISSQPKQAKEKPKSSDSTSPNAPAILTTRREALSLYRSIWRATALFTWSTDSKTSPLSPTGELWRDALRRSARQEFEASKQFERDPVMVARMLVVGRDAVAQAVDKLAAKAAEVEKGLRSGGGGEGGRGGDSNGGSSSRL